MTQRTPPPLLAVLILGTVCQIGQVLLLRELLMVFHGSELSIGVILSAWLAWVGIGSGLGAVLSARVSRPGLLLLISAAGVLLALPATILLIRGLRGFLDAYPGAYLSLSDVVISSFLLLAPACLMLGAQFVLLARVWREHDQAADTSGAGKTYIGEAAGSVVGGVVFTFLMVRHLTSMQSAVLAGMLMLAGVLFVTWRSAIGAGGVSPGLRVAASGLLALAIVAFPLLSRLDDWAYRLQWRDFMPDHQLVATQQSKYGTIAVLRREGQYSFYQSGHLMFSTAGPATVAPAFEEQDAAAFVHLSMVQHENPRHVLLIGGGLRGTLGEIARHPVDRIDYLELDEMLTEVARPYVSSATLDGLADPRVRLMHTDGRLFVKGAEDRYDLVIVDAPDPTTAVLNRFYTREFFREVEALLNPGGVLVVGATSTADLRATAVANRNSTIYHTLREVFPRVLPAGDRHLLFFATDSAGQVSIDVPTLQERYLEREIATPGFSHQHYHTLLPESQVRRVGWLVRGHGRTSDAHLAGPSPVPLSPGTVVEQEHAEAQLAPVEEEYFINSDLKPIGYFYTLMVWDDLAGTGHRQAFERLLRVESHWMLLLAGIPVLSAAGLRMTAGRIGREPGTRFAVLFTVFTTGLSTMALQIGLLFAFQSIYGFVYEMVGLIVAIFMGGLALGTLLSHRYVADKASLRTLSHVQALIALVSVLFAIVLPRSAAVPSQTTVFLLFSTLTLLAGVINGVDFPLAAACYMALRRQPERASGTVYGVELLGACVGAAVVSVVVVPVLGIVASCFLAAVANGTAYGVLRISGRSYA